MIPLATLTCLTGDRKPVMGSWFSKEIKHVGQVVKKEVKTAEHDLAQIDITNKSLPFTKKITHALAQIDPTNNSLPFAKAIQMGLNVLGTAVGAGPVGTDLSVVGKIHADILRKGASAATPEALAAAAGLPAPTPESSAAAMAAMTPHIPGNNTMLYIGIGAAALVGIILLAGSKK
jgi:hypothetical protein